MQTLGWHFIRRLGETAAILLVVSILVFVGCEILPGDAAQLSLGQFATAESVRILHEQFGLDRPAPVRYLTWLWGFLSGDWGTSITTKTPVRLMLADRLQNTALLTVSTAIIAVPLAVGTGLLMALHARSRFDRVLSTIVLALSATPEFLIGTIAVLVFSVKLNWLPAVAYIPPDGSYGQTARALVLPVATLVIVIVAQIARMTRATIVSLLDQPFIQMARLKGASRTRIILIHAFINAIGPIANVVALNIAYLISGVVVVETIFAYPGIARLMVDAVQARDLPVVQACAMVFCIAYVSLILGADLLAMYGNPRLRSMMIANRGAA